MNSIQRKEVKIFKEDFSYLFLQGKDQNKKIFFFHATGFNAETYAPFINSLHEQLNEDYSIYALDQRGHGLTNASAEPSELKSWKTYFMDGKDFVNQFSAQENIIMGHSMGGVVASNISYKLQDNVKKIVLIDPVIQPESLKIKLPIPNFLRAVFFLLKSFFSKSRATEMISNARKRRSEFLDQEEIFKHYFGRGAFKDWPEEFLRSYIKGGTKTIGQKINLSCHPEWESKTFAVSYNASVRFIKKITIPAYVPYASIGSTFSNSAMKMVNNKKQFIFEEIDGSHFFPMEKKDLLCNKIKDFIYQP